MCQKRRRGTQSFDDYRGERYRTRLEARFWGEIQPRNGIELGRGTGGKERVLGKVGGKSRGSFEMTCLRGKLNE